jgi:hypothetical protein
MLITFEQDDYLQFAEDCIKQLKRSFMPCEGLIDSVTIDCALFQVYIDRRVSFTFADGSEKLSFPVEAFISWCVPCARMEFELSMMRYIPELADHPMIEKWLDAGKAINRELKKAAMKETVGLILSEIGIDASDLRVIPITSQDELSQLSSLLP